MLLLGFMIASERTASTEETANAASWAIQAVGLSKTYPGGTKALDNLSFSVETGTIFALLGPNGAGKSTTVKILTTLSKPNSGSARVAGFDVLREPEKVRGAIGCVAQKSAVDLQSTGRENLVLQGRLYAMNKIDLKQRVTELLERFRLSDAADRVSRTWSGGMQRKLDVAMGLIHRPSVLFLDEPTTGLDPEARSELWEEMARLANRDKLTVLLTTHYLEEADRLAQRVAIVDKGRIIVKGTPDQLKSGLRGDSIQVDFLQHEPEPRVRSALASVPGLAEIVVDAKSMRARAERGATAVPATLAALESAAIRVAAVRVARPSLDDVYLKHTGHSFNQTDEGESR